MYKSLEHTIRNIVEETEHRVGVTVSDPNHPMASKRDEAVLKHVRLKAKNPAHAEERAKAYYRKKGYKVHDTNVVHESKGEHDQEVHDHYTWLKKQPTGDVLRMHRARHKISHNYTARDAGGKDAMISGLMRDKFGHKRVAAHFGLSEDIGNTDKFVGNNQTDKPVPVIKPDATQDAKRASLSRVNAKERTSQTMGNNVEEAVPHSVYHVSWGGGVEHQVLAKHGEDAIAKAKAHLISKSPKLKDPKYADTFAKKPYVHNITKERKLQEDNEYIEEAKLTAHDVLTKHGYKTDSKTGYSLSTPTLSHGIMTSHYTHKDYPGNKVTVSPDGKAKHSSRETDTTKAMSPKALHNYLNSYHDHGVNIKEGMADDAKEFALDVAPVIGTKRSYDRAKDAYNKGDYLGTAVHGGLTAVGAAGDLALASGVGSLAGAGLKGLAAKAGGYALKKLAGRTAAAGAEKAAVGAGERAAVGAGEKAVAAGAGEKVAAAAEKGAAERAAANVEKGAAEKATAGVEKQAAGSVAKNTAGQAVKNAVRNTMARAGLSGGNTMQNPLANRRGELRHTAPVSVSRAKKHIVHEASGDAERMKDQAVPRLSNKKRTEVDYVGRPDSPRSILTRQGEVTRKVIDEDSRAKAKTIKDTVKKKSIEQNLDDDRTKVFGDVIVNPPINFKNLNDVEQAS
jgi:hypothetical protein